MVKGAGSVRNVLSERRQVGVRLRTAHVGALTAVRLHKFGEGVAGIHQAVAVDSAVPTVQKAVLESGSRGL